MVIRSLAIAALLAGAGAAHATPTSSTASMLGGWTLQSGSVNVIGALNSMDAIVASGNWAAFSQAWSMHTNLTAHGDASGNSAVLFAPSAAGGMSGGGFGGGAAPAVGGGASGGGGGGGGAGGSTGGGGGGGSGGNTGTGGGNGGGIDAGAGGGIGIGGGGVDVGFPGAGGGLIDVTGAGDVIEPAEIPEPGSIALLLAGLAGAGFASRRRSR